MKAFLRLAAVFVGLANLGLLAIATESFDDAPFLLPVLTAVIAGLATTQLVLRWFDRQILAERFSDRCAIMVVVVCLGGILTGGLLAAALALDGSLVQGPLSVPEQVLATVFIGMLGASFGFILGMVEGLLLAFPLAAILGQFRSASQG